VKIRIVRQPSGQVYGMALHLYRPDRVYDLPASVAEYLVAQGFALLEMRGETKKGFGGLDRRDKKSEK
jgi:hypothetical protein